LPESAKPAPARIKVQTVVPIADRAREFDEAATDAALESQGPDRQVAERLQAMIDAGIAAQDPDPWTAGEAAAEDWT